MIAVAVSSDAQSCVFRHHNKGGSSGNALIGVPFKDRERKHTISLIDKGISLMPVLHKLRLTKDFISSKFSGNLVIFEQPFRRSNSNRPVSTNCGTSLIEVCSNTNVSIFCEIVGNLVTSRHRFISRNLRTFEPSIGNLLRLLQRWRLTSSSLSRY